MSNPPTKENTDAMPSVTQERQGYAPPKLDPEKYRAHLKDYDLTPEQENEFLQTVWNILSTFVYIGFGLDSVQLFQTADKEMTGKENDDALEQKEHTTAFNEQAGTETQNVMQEKDDG